MNKTKDHLIIEMSLIQDKSNIDEYELNQSVIPIINSRCINCAKHDTTNFRNNIYHICFDDWSGHDNGWHVIYDETLDLCAETRGNHENH